MEMLYGIKKKKNDLSRKENKIRLRHKNNMSFRAIYILLAFLILIMTGFECFALVLPNVDTFGRSGEKPEELLKDEVPPPPPTLQMPAAPAREKETGGQPLKSIFVRKINVTGSTVFSAQEIAAVTTPYENRNINMEDLETIRRALTILYINKGYMNSGAVLPDQTVADGVITYQIIEGKLTHIDVQGNKWFGEAFISDRIALGAKTPLNLSPLQDRLQLLQQDQRIERIRAELRPGAMPGESELKVTIEEKPPMSVWLAFNNYQSPSIGAERGLITFAHQNLTGHADTLSLTYGRSEGLTAMIDAWYTIPFTVYDTSLLIRYRQNDYKVVEDVFESLDIENKSEAYELSLRQPVYRTLNQELALVLGLEHERERTFMFGEPFSFYPGAEDGQSVVIPLRFSQEWTYRTQRQVFALRSRFSAGIGMGDATIHGDQPDGRFFAWQGQFQWARIFDFLDAQLLFRVDGQVTDDSLLPMEQISIGGRYSVRGYRENFLERDEGIIASLEARIPVIQNKLLADYIQVCPFYDYGRGDNKRMPTPDPQEISSVGVGLRWAASLTKSFFNLKAESEIYWGYPFTDVRLSHQNLQDNGIHFQIAITDSF